MRSAASWPFGSFLSYPILSRSAMLRIASIAAALIFISNAWAQTVSPAAPAPTSPNATPNSQQAPPPPPGTDSPHQTGAQQPISPEPGNDQGGMFVFKKQVEEVVLHATVYDEQRNMVPGLDKSAFTVFDDGAQQAITSFRREDVPVAMGIVVDNSGSMRDKREKDNQAVLNLIRASNPKDEVFVVNFNQEP